MNYVTTSRFKKAYKSLPGDIKECVKESLRKFSEDANYPSLGVKKIKGTKDIWEMRVNIDFRITFQRVKDYILLRNVGHHDPAIRNP